MYFMSRDMNFEKYFVCWYDHQASSKFTYKANYMAVASQNNKQKWYSHNMFCRNDSQQSHTANMNNKNHDFSRHYIPLTSKLLITVSHYYKN